VAAAKGGVGINMIKMNQVLQVNQSDMDVTVQAGVTRLAVSLAQKPMPGAMQTWSKDLV
jgi:FAD/FMN-containing dehydrogenase